MTVIKYAVYMSNARIFDDFESKSEAEEYVANYNWLLQTEFSESNKNIPAARVVKITIEDVV